jgi:hypothetical protein
VFSQGEQEGYRIVEYYPLCLNCKETVEEFINKRIRNLSLLPSDTSITVNYHLTAQGVVEKVSVDGTDNQRFIAIIVEATENLTDWIPAIHQNQPVEVYLQYRITLNFNSGEWGISAKHPNSVKLDNFLLERNRRYWEKYFEENSNNIISHLEITKVHSSISRRLNKGYHRRLTKSPYYKTGTIRFQTTGDKTSWSIYVPELKIADGGTSQYIKNIRIKDIPQDHHIILIVIQEKNNRVEISINEFTYTGQRNFNFSFSEYSYHELNKEIERLIDR